MVPTARTTYQNAAHGSSGCHFDKKSDGAEGTRKRHLSTTDARTQSER